MIDGKLLLNVILALIIFKLIDKLFLDSLFSKIMPESFEGYEAE